MTLASGIVAVELLMAATVIAMNPPAIAGVVLLLASPQSRRSAWWFAAGWMLGLAAVGALVLAVGDIGRFLAVPEAVGYAIKGLVGIALLVLAVVKLGSRGSNESGERPRWMDKLAEMTPAKALVTAALYAAVNPKTLALKVTGALVIVEATANVPLQIGLLVAFVVASSLSVVAPLVYYASSPRTAGPRLEAVQSWLAANSALVGAAVLFVLGAMLVVPSVRKLIGG